MLSRHNVFVPSGEQALINLEPNGRCMFRSFDSHGRYLASEGTWELLHNIKFNSPNATRNTLRIIINAGERESEVKLSFARCHGEIVMWDYYDDPDGQEYIEYCRRAASYR